MLIPTHRDGSPTSVANENQRFCFQTVDVDLGISGNKVVVVKSHNCQGTFG